MRTLLSLAAAALFCAPAFAQSDVALGQQAGIAYMVSNDQAVESRVAYAGYLFDKAELDVTNDVAYSNGFDIQIDGLFYDYSVHARSETTPWAKGADRYLEWAVQYWEPKGKRKAQDELKLRAEGLARAIKKAAAQRNMDAQSTKLDAIKNGIPSATEGIAQLALARDLDRLEATLP